MRRLRIAYLADGSLSHIGPYIDFAKSRGHEVSLIAFARGRRDYGVPTYDISRGATGTNTSSKWKYFLAGVSIRRLLRTIRPDILHGHYVTSAGTISLMSGFRPYVLTVHGSDLMTTHHSRIWRPVLKAAFSRAAFVNTVSEQLRDIAADMGIPDSKLLVATLGVDTQAFAYRPPAPFHAPVRLLCTRTLAELYDPGTIVRACHLLRQRGCDFRLTFAAGGVMQAQVEQLVREHNLQNHISFLGGYDPTKLVTLLREHDLYVSATLWDGTSISLLEAMAAGIVPILSRIPSNQAWVQDGETALLFDCRDSEQLACQIEKAIAQPEWISQAAAANRAEVEKRGDRHANMLRLEQAYYQIVQ